MNECIECLHYQACKDTHDILDTACRGEFDYEALARGCKNFTDRSEWVHLPCKVGDTVCVYEYDGEVTEYCVQGPCPNFKTVEQIKTEANKEFAERLKEHAYLDSGITGYQEMVVDLSDIENIADEM